jgi:hypothetical protein
MMTIPQFWFYAAFGVAVLICLLGVECMRASRAIIPFDRGRHWFNVSILCALVLGAMYFTYALELHRKHLDLLITPYPSARYAPERESFPKTEKWVYVSRDSADAIITFYQQESARASFALVVNKGTTTSRLLFSRNEEQLFLTIENEGDVRVLYYSREGSAQIMTE